VEIPNISETLGEVAKVREGLRRLPKLAILLSMLC
jgi:hypothetical protein